MFLAFLYKKMLVGTDFDKYYTPPAVARRALELAQLDGSPNVCADTACGTGSLLLAAEEVLSAMHCLGIDSDRLAIQRLRREQPDWRLFVGDLLKRHRPPPTDFVGANYGVDLLVLNPPFSLGSRKYLTIKYLGNPIKCSVAMAHILRSLELLKPSQGAIAVVPESLLYSETDADARELLAQNFSISELLELSIYTFKGARVNSSFVQLRASSDGLKASHDVVPPLTSVIRTTMLRGGLQMHTFKSSRAGARVIHSTCLRSIALGGIEEAKARTATVSRGRLSGWLLLLPRVGVPNQAAFVPVYAKEEVQLSDCVIGMKFSSKSAAVGAAKRVHSHWQSLVGLYKGTGARYVTLERLANWLCSIGIYDRDAHRKLQEFAS